LDPNKDMSLGKNEDFDSSFIFKEIAEDTVS